MKTILQVSRSNQWKSKNKLQPTPSYLVGQLIWTPNFVPQGDHYCTLYMLLTEKLFIHLSVIDGNKYTNTKHHGHIVAQRSNLNFKFDTPQDLDIPDPQCGSHKHIFQSNMGDPDWFWYNLAMFLKLPLHTKHLPRQYIYITWLFALVKNPSRLIKMIPSKNKKIGLLRPCGKNGGFCCKSLHDKMSKSTKITIQFRKFQGPPMARPCKPHFSLIRIR